MACEEGTQCKDGDELMLGTPFLVEEAVSRFSEPLRWGGEHIWLAETIPTSCEAIPYLRECLDSNRSTEDVIMSISKRYEAFGSFAFL